MSSKWQSFFSATQTPANYDETIDALRSFVERKGNCDQGIVLVSSGGTAVPLESRTVRFIDNFSVGTRGSTSTEYFLNKGYAVIFLHRKGSLEPYKRHFQHINFLDLLTVENDTPKVKDDKKDTLCKTLQRYRDVQNSGNLLNIPFTTLAEYLCLLKGTAQVLQTCGKDVMFYLAAAVSDFYIPSDEMPEHKIQSSSGPLQISLQLVPKMLEPLISEWAPSAFVTSFKLETDVNLLIPKSKQALTTYNHQVVIGNILETRKKEVTIVTNTDVESIVMTNQELTEGKEIEEKIIEKLAHLHSLYKQQGV